VAGADATSAVGGDDSDSEAVFALDKLGACDVCACAAVSRWSCTCGFSGDGGSECCSLLLSMSSICIHDCV
jgi:hypothetical protein